MAPGNKYTREEMIEAAVQVVRKKGIDALTAKALAEEEIRKLRPEDIPACAEIMCSVYNNELWMCRWEKETAAAYLLDFYHANKFVGYVLCEEDKVIGAIFAHEKIWWNNSEVFIDEMFITPERQRCGLGTMLLNKMEQYVKEHQLAGLTLSTNKYAPALLFYKKNGFTECEHILFLSRAVSM